ncbi:MAG: serpin family protein [Gemmataceae bacterium]
MPPLRLAPALLLAAAAAFAAAPPAAQPRRLPPPRPVVEADTRPLVDGNNRFALDLYRQLSLGEGNLFFSPHAIASSLTLTSAGAAGKTLEQMTRTLHAPRGGAFEMAAALDQDLAGRTGKGIHLTSVNRVWVQDGLPIRPTFRAALESAGAGLKEADFQVNPDAGRKAVNEWASKHTDRQIEDLLPAGSVTPLTRVVLASAVTFKGDWASKFKAERTRPGEFATPKGKATVPMMSQHGAFLLGHLESGPVIELPYAGDQLTMVIAVPGGDKKLSDVEREVADGRLDAGLAKGAKQKVEVVLPRFKMAASLRLPAALRAMGMDDAFGPTADFSAIDGTRDLYLSGVFHKAALDVNEDGTVAAAATGAVISARSRVVFHADQPFVFVIRDRKSGAILFMGRVLDPR